MAVDPVSVKLCSFSCELPSGFRVTFDLPLSFTISSDGVFASPLPGA
jgi:hypothetical protein